MLGKDIQLRNMRKVKVNAQVTFVIYILECMANLSLLIFWIFVNGMTSAITVTIGIVWFHIVLPYTFLMNTSHNKNLLTEDGWWNTIRNAVGFFGNFDGATPRPIVPRLETPKSSLQLRQLQQELSHGDVQVTSMSNTSSLMVNSKPPCKQNANPNIFLISKPENIQQHNSRKSHCITGALASTREKVLNFEDSRKEPKRPIMKQTSSSDEENQTPQTNHHLYLGEKIMCNMLIYIDNEDEYLHYLKQLAHLEETFNQGAFQNDFEIVHLSDLPTPKMGNVKHSTPKPKYNVPEKIEISGPINKSKNISKQMVILNIEFIGQLAVRIEKRKRLLEHFQTNCRNEDSYKTFTNRIFDFEESLII